MFSISVTRGNTSPGDAETPPVPALPSHSITRNKTSVTSSKTTYKLLQINRSGRSRAAAFYSPALRTSGRNLIYIKKPQQYVPADAIERSQRGSWQSPSPGAESAGSNKALGMKIQSKHHTQGIYFPPKNPSRQSFPGGEILPGIPRHAGGRRPMRRVHPVIKMNKNKGFNLYL